MERKRKEKRRAYSVGNGEGLSDFGSRNLRVGVQILRRNEPV